MRVATDLIETMGFSEAKSRLSDLMTAVVHERRPKAIGRHRGKEEMFLLGRDELLDLIESFEFRPLVSVSDDEFVVTLPELGLIAANESLEAAFDELVEVAEAYAELYLSRYEFYRETDRRRHLPWVARIAFTRPEARRELFIETPTRSSALLLRA